MDEGLDLAKLRVNVLESAHAEVGVVCDKRSEHRLVCFVKKSLAELHDR